MNSKDLNELIQKNTRVILPEFGAFLIKEGGESGFNPANVSFSPFLRYNDGMLEVYIAKSKGISKEEASKEVREFVELLKNELQEKGSFPIETIGQLKKDSRGSLAFSLFENNNISGKDDQPNSEPNETKTQPQVNSEAEIVSETPKKTKKGSATKEKAEKATTPKKQKTTKTKESTDSTPSFEVNAPIEAKPTVEVAQEPKVEEINKEKEAISQDQPTVKTEDQPKQPIIVQKEEEKKDHIIIEPEEKQEKGHRFVLYGVIALIVVGIAFIIYYYYLPPNVESINENLNQLKVTEATSKPEEIKVNDKIENPKDEIDKAFNEANNDNKEKTVKKEEQKKKEDAQEEAIKSQVIQEVKQKQEIKTKVESKTEQKVKYYLIIGSFRDKALANKFSEEQKKLGYNTIVVTQPSGMNAVSLGSYNTKDEATKASNSYKKKFPNIWILKK